MSFDDLIANSLFQPVVRITRPDISFGTLRRALDAIGYMTKAHGYYTELIRFSAKTPRFSDYAEDPDLRTADFCRNQQGPHAAVLQT